MLFRSQGFTRKEQRSGMTDTFLGKNSKLDSQYWCMILHLFSGKFESRWFGPCIIKRDLGHGAFRVQSSNEGTFKVNGQRMMHYVVGEKIDSEDTEPTEEDELEDAGNTSSA